MTTTTYVNPKPRKKYPRLAVRPAAVAGWNVWRLSDPIHAIDVEHFPTFHNALNYVRDQVDHHEDVKRVREMGVS